MFIVISHGECKVGVCHKLARRFQGIIRNKGLTTVVLLLLLMCFTIWVGDDRSRIYNSKLFDTLPMFKRKLSQEHVFAYPW